MRDYIHHVLKEWRFTATMLVAVGAICALAYLDARRESRQALDEFAVEQATLLDTALRIATGSEEWRSNPEAAIERARTAVEGSGASRLLTREGGKYLDRGHPIDQPELVAALQANQVVLDRTLAESIGLPARMAVGASRTVPLADGRPIEVALVTSAAKLRDRERWAQWRLLVSVLGGGAIVLGFGLVSLRRLRRQLGLEHRLALAEVSRRSEEQLAKADKLATAGALATRIAHEVSTPLSVIVARAEQLRGWVADNPKAARAVQTILDQAERIGAIVRGLLGLIRGDTIGFRQVEPRTLIGDLRGLVEHRFERAHVSLVVEPCDCPPMACDPLLLSQALVNILLNACEASSAGGTVRLTARAQGNLLELKVLDEGAGISKADAAHATEPLFTTKPPGSGTGLGLAIASEIVKHHRGTLAIGPRAGGVGTEVTIRLPIGVEGASHAAA